MGTFWYTIELSAVSGTQSEEIEALVDTGATYTWIPRPVLERLGITPTIKRRVKVADGRIIERDGAQIHVRLDGETLSTICLFGDEGSEPLLGAVTLEEFGLGVDTINRQLVPVVALLMRSCCE
jgi:clan AA aspartic protease